MFVIEVITFKWGANAPFPSYAKLAKRMGIGQKMVQRYAKQLEEKGYLKREARIGNSKALNLQALFDALAAAVEEERTSMPVSA